MSLDVIFFLSGVAIIFLLVVVNLLVWLRPELLLKKGLKDSALIHSGVATFLAIALFLSCFLAGVWLSIMKLQGRLGVYL